MPRSIIITANLLLAASAAFVGSPARVIQQQRTRAVVAQIPKGKEDVDATEEKVIIVELPSKQGLWNVLPGSGLKYVDEKIGEGAVPSSDAVVSLHYTVSFASGQELGSSRNGPFHSPLTFALGKHPVAVFPEAIEGMRIGGKRRVVVPPAKIPESQTRNVPKDQEGEPLNFEIELLGVHSGVKALIPSLLPPGNRRLTIARFFFALSFIPYFLPEDIKPNSYKMYDGKTPEEVREMYAERQISRSLGTNFDADAFNALFAEDAAASGVFPK